MELLEHRELGHRYLEVGTRHEALVGCSRGALDDGRGCGFALMNVLQVIHYPFFGGPQNQALQLARPLAAHETTTTVVLPDDFGNAAQRLRDAGIEVIPASLHRLRATVNPIVQARFLAGVPSEVAALRRLIREQSIDVVQVAGLVNPHAAIAARLERVGVVWQLLDTRAPMALRRVLMPWVLTLADVVMTTGLGVARVHPGATALGPRLIPYFPPVDISEFRPDSARRVLAREALGVASSTPLVGTVANITPQKGLEHFVAVADGIHAILPDTRFVILGSLMETHAEYERYIQGTIVDSAAGRADAIRVVNPGNRVSELLPALDLFLLTSVPRSEGVSTTVLEAMATGIAVVSTDVGALSEVVEDRVTGRIVAALDDSAMVEVVAALLVDAGQRLRMATIARQRATQLYDVNVCAETHMRAYRLAASRASRRRVRRR